MREINKNISAIIIYRFNSPGKRNSGTYGARWSLWAVVALPQGPIWRFRAQQPDSVGPHAWGVASGGWLERVEGEQAAGLEGPAGSLQRPPPEHCLWTCTVSVF